MKKRWKKTYRKNQCIARKAEFLWRLIQSGPKADFTKKWRKLPHVNTKEAQLSVRSFQVFLWDYLFMGKKPHFRKAWSNGQNGRDWDQKKKNSCQDFKLSNKNCFSKKTFFTEIRQNWKQQQVLIQTQIFVFNAADFGTIMDRRKKTALERLKAKKWNVKKFNLWKQLSF